jgi:Pyruvate kinase, barrel domain
VNKVVLDTFNQILILTLLESKDFPNLFTSTCVKRLALHSRSHQPKRNCIVHTNTMISNTGSIPTLHGGNITLQTVKHVTDVTNRRTKIVCTMGPGSWSEEGLATLMDTGMNVARFNFSHGDHEGHGQVLARLRKVAAAKARNIGTYEQTACSSIGESNMYSRLIIFL